MSNAPKPSDSGSIESTPPVAPPPLPSARKTPPSSPQQPVSNAAQQRATPEPADASDAPVKPRRRLISRDTIQNTGAFTVSMVAHSLILIILGLWMLPEVVKTALPELTISHADPIEQEELTVELDEQIEPATDTGFSEITPGVDSGGGAAAAAAASQPVFDRSVEETVSQSAKISLDHLYRTAPAQDTLIAELPKGTLGDSRAIVDDYNQAMDRITQEILLLMSVQKVLVVWCFDQSDSMKDDRDSIRDRIERVYIELGLSGKTEGDLLTTSIVSYGSQFRVHTQQPTGDVDKVRAAIDEVPNDPSGKEIMCQAIIRAIEGHKNYIRKTRRRMALILVTDESGEREENEQFLEPAIQTAKDAGCITYILGREAVFGYPYAHFRWIHPQTKEHHWLPVDRGPETGFVEQLQTNGFHRRYDAFPSGFGPYEQARLAQETGGIFFMLPGLESNIVRGDDRRYELEAMRPYRPDLRSRTEVLKDRDTSILRRGVYQVIYDLNPYRAEIARWISMRVHFSRDPNEFAKQVNVELAKAVEYFKYLNRASQAIEALERERAKELSPRWQANIDLIHAQLLAYQVRLYEYGAYLEYFMKNVPEGVPVMKPPNKYLRWDIDVRKERLTGDQHLETIKRSQELFEKVIADHPGTPWAALAAQELRRGFGVRLVPTYHEPIRNVTGPLVPIPKL
ncbi:MAG: VWA domain-containing protein [Planctomycetales bacterium]|nr:VWA domain-containing protein [Planctomycetales bacterium]